VRHGDDFVFGGVDIAAASVQEFTGTTPLPVYEPTLAAA